MSDSFQNRLCQAMAVRGVSQAELAKGTGLSRPRISQYVNGTYEAKQQALYKIAHYLKVDVSWLMGYDVPMEPEEIVDEAQLQIDKSTPSILDLIQEQCGETAKEAFAMYLALDNDDRGEIRGEMKQMLKAEKYSAEEGLKNA